MLIRLLTCALLLLAPLGLSAQTAGHAAFIKRVTRKMAYVAVLDCEAVGRAPITTNQYLRFDSLRRQCSTEELGRLVAHKSPVVRSYAFWALSERPEAELFPLLLRHRRDTAEFEQHCGCFGSPTTVVDFMLGCYQKSAQYRSDSLAAGAQQVVAVLKEQHTDRWQRWRQHHQQLSPRQRQRLIRKDQRLEARNDD